MKNSQVEIDQMKLLISNGKSALALKMFKESLQKSQIPEIFNEVIVMEGQLTELKNRNRKGIISYTDFQIEKNQIDLRLAELIDLYYNSRLINMPSTSLRSIKVGGKPKIILFVGVILIMIVGFYNAKNQHNNHVVEAIAEGENHKDSLERPTIDLEDTLNSKLDSIQEVNDRQVKNVIDKTLPRPKKQDKLQIQKAENRVGEKAINVEGFWTCVGQNAYAEVTQDSTALWFKMYGNTGKFYYEGVGKVLGDSLHFKYEWLAGPGNLNLRINNFQADTLTGTISNPATKNRKEPVLFIKKQIFTN